MILAVDAGNSVVTLGCVDGRDILNLARLETSCSRSADEYAVLMERVLALKGVKLREFEGAAIASVVPPLTEVLREAVRLVTGHDALVIGAGVKTGLNIGIDDPSQMGADLVAGAVAALDAHEPPVIIIDMGTATTITVIGPNARLLGGAIIPGAAVSLEALSNAASLLPRISLDAPKRAIGSGTIECMKWRQGRARRDGRAGREDNPLLPARYRDRRLHAPAGSLAHLAAEPQGAPP